MLALGPNEIDCWLIDSRNEDPKLCEAILNCSEWQRAERYKNRTLRRRFIVNRAMVRQILSRYLIIGPAEIEFAVGEFGKPALDGVAERSGVVFNVSHSGEYLAVVVAREQLIGVDIEQHKASNALPGLVKKCFADTEAHYWRSLPEAQRRHVFYDIWTCKESFVKAVGRGIALGLNQCVLALPDSGRWLSVPDSYAPADAWKSRALTLTQGYSGAITSNKLTAEVRYQCWSGGSASAEP